MTKKQIITRVTAFAILFSFSTTHVFADINLGNQDGTGFSSAHQITIGEFIQTAEHRLMKLRV